MAVLIEVLSLVIRVERVAERFPGGWMAFESRVMNHPSYCSDGELARLAFLTPEDVKALVGDLAAAGLEHLDADGRAVDMVVVDQRQGPMSPADWLEFHHVDFAPDGSRPIPVARLKGSTETRTAFPRNWTWEGSPFGLGLQ